MGFDLKKERDKQNEDSERYSRRAGRTHAQNRRFGQLNSKKLKVHSHCFK